MKINSMKKTILSILFTIMLIIIPLSSAYNLNTYYEKQKDDIKQKLEQEKAVKPE